jgi:hypothetical protein
MMQSAVGVQIGTLKLTVDYLISCHQAIMELIYFHLPINHLQKV